jgi:hypothetical protein
MPRLIAVTLLAAIAINGCGAPAGATPSTAAASREPTDAELADQTLSAYMGEVVGRDFDAAWARLAPGAQRAFGSREQFTSEKLAYLQSAGSAFVMPPPTHDVALLRQFTDGLDDAPPLDRAYIVQVDFPGLAGNNAGYWILVTAPDATGEWRVWQVR